MTAADRQQPVPPAPEVEREIAFDMLKRGVWFVPVLLLGSTMIWGVEGFATALLAIAVVTVNLVIAALALSWAAKISLTAIMAVALGGFALRMALVVAVLFGVHDATWVNMTALAILILVTHLGLLFWELRYVSASLAFPGLKPTTDKEAVA